MKEVIWAFLIIILILFLVPIPWSGHHAFSLGNTSKNAIFKSKHFFFKMPLNKSQCNLNLVDFKYAMGTIPFWLSEGTALGAIRDNDFITHDDDVDVGMWAHDLDRFNKEALPLLYKLGFTLDMSLFNGTFIMMSRNGERLDIDAVSSGGQCMAARTASANCGTCDCIIPYLNDMHVVQMHDEEYMVPGTPYLKYLYGVDWHIPQKRK